MSKIIRYLLIAAAFCLAAVKGVAQDRAAEEEKAVVAGVVSAQTDDLTEEERMAREKSDSIDRVALDEDFIKVSFVYAEPSEVVYSMAGHALLRLQSPSNGLDICYTFAMGEETMDIVRFLGGRSMATYVFSPTEKYLKQYEEEGREVKEITLNLSPRQEQELWRYLDSQMMGDVMYRYDYLHTNCSYMTARAVDLALGKERIVYGELPEGLSGEYGSFRHLLSVLVDDSPWLKIFWNITLGEAIDRDCPLETMLLPAYLWQTWPKASIASEDGQLRPMTVGEPRVLLKSRLHKHPMPFTPNMAGALLLVLAIVASLWDWARSKEGKEKGGWWQRVFRWMAGKENWLGKVLDGTLLAGQTLVSVWVVYLPILYQGGNSWNWMMLVFNPLPLLLWLTMRKRKVWRAMCVVMGVVPLLFVASFSILPQMDFYNCFLHLLFLSFSLRAFCQLLPRKSVQK